MIMEQLSNEATTNTFIAMLEKISKLYEDKEKLTVQVLELKKGFDPVLDRPLQSEQIDKLTEAMAKAQMEYPQLGPNSLNTYNSSKYSNLENILFVVRPLLSKHGIQFEQKPYTTRDNLHWLITSIKHAGQWSESRTRVIPETSVKTSGYQEYGKAQTYQARYAAMCMLGIRPTKDELDDDGQSNAKEKEYEEITKNPMKIPAHKPNNQETISDDEIREIRLELQPIPAYLRKMLDKYDIDELEDLPKVFYREVIDRIREIKSDLKTVKQ
jgi:hypothetical protein